MIPISTDSRAIALIKQVGWKYTASGSDQAVIETCPFCDNSNSKFYINISGGEKDAMWDCKVCGETGNIHQLKEKLGIRAPNAMSLQDAAMSAKAPAPLPNFALLHKRLMTDEGMGDVLDYLVATRKFSTEILDKMMIGAEEFEGKKWFVMPYFDKSGNPTYYKARSVPPADKQFRSPHGREVGLYNEAALQPGMDELVMVESESGCLSLLSAGYVPVVGIPGANVKKAAWLEKLDRLAPKVIYTLYDNDKVGQKAAREIATRIGLEKVKNIVLPEFDNDGKPGKDINEYFGVGHNLADFLALRDAAKAFHVPGVQPVGEVLLDLVDELNERPANQATYDSPWPSLNRRLGGFEPGDVVGIMAEGKVGKTSMALNWLDYLAFNGHPSFMFCQEMSPKRLVRKWVSMVTKTDDTPGKSSITADTVKEALGMADSYKGDLLFGFTSSSDYKEVIETIRQAVRRYGVKIVCFDNLQMLVTSLANAAQQTGAISKGFKSLAMELGIAILLIIQPNRVKDGELVAARNAMGSSAVEKDVDSMVCMHRNRVGKIRESDFQGFMDTDENFEPNLLVRVDLSRYAPGGTCTLWMDGATSTVRELSPEDLAVTLPTTGGPIPIAERQEI